MTRLAPSAAAAQLVERQMRNWEIARRQRHDVPPAERPETGDFICLSRPFGVDASRVAKGLGEVLDWPVFDKQVLDEMAGDDRTRRLIYQAMDQRDLAWWEAMVQPLIRGRFPRDDYFHRLCDTLLGLARQGDGIFVGRGADLILPASRGLRVRLTASIESRLHHLADAGVPRSRVHSELRRVEEERRSFLHNHFAQESDDPTRHDLVINLDRFSTEEAVELILDARRLRGRRATQPGPAGP